MQGTRASHARSSPPAGVWCFPLRNPVVRERRTRVARRAGFSSSGGNGSIQVIIRALGPTLTQFGVNGALTDPTLALIDGNGNIVASSDNWKNTQQSTIQATGFAPPNDLESAILVTLPNGNYTAIVSGKNGTTGVGLLEVYKVALAASQ